MKFLEEGQRVHVVDEPWCPLDVIKQVVEDGIQEDPFYVMDLGEVVARYHRWKELMPRVEPFYAVKCNDDRMLVSALAALGAGFDCASRNEIQMVTALGVASERIIFANPAKMASHIRYAGAAGVRLLTFDSEIELAKIKQNMPNAELVIRIRCDAEEAQCPLGIKFGCDALREAPRLLKVAAALHLQVVGVSFHAGSGARGLGVWARGVRLAKSVFATAARAGHAMRIVDIGGGFPGDKHDDIQQIAEVINSSLETHFPVESGVRVIAEPGRHFAAAAYTLAAMIHAKREVGRDVLSPEIAQAEARAGAGSSAGAHTMYFINDGVYGSFNCLLYDHRTVRPEPLQDWGDESSWASCSVWGPSCDGLDVVCAATRLPASLRAGQWLVFRDMGAYTLPVASPFNGYPVPAVRYVATHQVWRELKDRAPLTEAHFVMGGRLTGPQSPPPTPPLCEPPTATDADAQYFVCEAAPPLYVECALK